MIKIYLVEYLFRQLILKDKLTDLSKLNKEIKKKLNNT